MHCINFVRNMFFTRKQDFWVELILILCIFIDLTATTTLCFTTINPKLHTYFVIFDTGLCIALLYKFAENIRSYNNKRIYIKQNPKEVILDVITIIPYELLFLGPFGFIRLIRFIKILVLLRKGKNNIFIFIEKTRLKYTLLIFIITIIAGTTGIYIIENSPMSQIHSPLDSLWYVMATISTVGYGDITPLTWKGKIFGILLTIIGLCIGSLLTAGLSAWMLKHEQLEENQLKNEIKNLRTEIDKLQQQQKKKNNT